MKKQRFAFHIATAFCLALMLSFTGCGTTRTAVRTPAIDSARSTYYQAKSNPVVVSNAPVTLHEAAQSLEKAERAENEEQQRHYAYLAQKQTEQAVFEANQKAAEQNIAELGQERQQVQLRAREQEATRAREQAQLAQQQAQTAEQQAALARQQAIQLETELSELKARQTREGNVMLTLTDIMFAVNQAVLNPGAMLSLDKLANILQQNPNEKIYIEGHTDSTGTAAYNQQLSTARANAVRQALMERGVSADRIIARGLGESFPVASNQTQAGRQLNRRVDIIVTG